MMSMHGTIDRRTPILAIVSVWLAIAYSSKTLSEETENARWLVGDPILTAGPAGTADEVSVKDPTIVYYDGAWHLFYTARDRSEYTTRYVSAKELSGLQTAPRHDLPMIRGQARYGCAPQVFWYQPQGRWYLVFQTRDANYQPMFSTTATIARPDSWGKPKRLIEKDSPQKWIDFWVICDRSRAYLFYTQGHRDVMVRSTTLDAFPQGWGEASVALTGVHEAVHVYRAKGRDEFHLIYELNQGGVRSFGLATAEKLAGPWRKVTDRYATGEQLDYIGPGDPWTKMVSHGEAIRTGYDQQLEYNPADCRWLIQGLRREESQEPYPELPWKLGVILRSEK